MRGFVAAADRSASVCVAAAIAEPVRTRRACRARAKKQNKHVTASKTAHAPVLKYDLIPVCRMVLMRIHRCPSVSRAHKAKPRTGRGRRAMSSL